MSKIILVIACLLAVAFAGMIEIKKRSTAPESLALEIEFAGTCREWNQQMLESVWVSRNTGCLPIQVDAPTAIPPIIGNPDFDDLQSHWFCTDYSSHGRAIVHFVEIFSIDSTNPTSNPENSPATNFVVSFLSKRPFRVLTPGTTISRRPDCLVTENFCQAGAVSTAVVNSCRSNSITRQKGFVVNQDRVYITAGQGISTDCRTSTSICCAYITPRARGGICARKSTDDLVEFPKRPHHDNSYDNDDKNHGRPNEQTYGNRPQVDRPNEQTYGDRPQVDRPNQTYGERPNGNRPNGNRPNGNRPNGNRPNGNRPQVDRPNQTYGERPVATSRPPQPTYNRPPQPTGSNNRPQGWRHEDDEDDDDDKKKKNVIPQ